VGKDVLDHEAGTKRDGVAQGEDHDRGEGHDSQPPQLDTGKKGQLAPEGEFRADIEDGETCHTARGGDHEQASMKEMLGPFALGGV